MRLATTSLVVLMLMWPAPAQAIKIAARGTTSKSSAPGADKTFDPHKKIHFQATEVTSVKASFLWDIEGVGQTTSAPDTIELGDTVYVWAAPGSYRVRLTAIDFENKKVERASITFAVTGTPAPPEPGPTPPGPGPTPPGPTPPLPRPIPGTGMKVLIIYETADLSKLPAAQLAALYSKTVRDYLNQKCVVGPDGKTKEWRLWDKDVVTTGETETWKTAMKDNVARAKSLPWIVIASDTKAGSFEGPLPASTEQLLALLKKYAEGVTVRVMGSKSLKSVRPARLSKK